MIKYIFTLAVLLVASTTVKADDGAYDIKIEVNGIHNDNAILAYYFSESKYIRDTIHFDENGVGFITDTAEIPTGVYLLAFPQLKLNYFELILGEEKRFSMKTDTSNLVKQMIVENSLENELFYQNLKYMLDVGKTSHELKESIKGLDKNDSEYERLNQELVQLDKEVKKYRKDLAAKHPDSYYSTVFNMMEDVEIPENPNPNDSAFAYRYYQNHYFDNMDLTDERLSRTPVFMSRIKKFLDYYTLPYPDSINAAIDRVIAMAEPNYNMYQIVVSSIFNKYAKSNIMTHELVYVHMAKKYYAHPEVVDWIEEEQRAKIVDLVRKKEPTLLGNIAPDIVIADIEGKTRTLYEEAEARDYTILVIWNSGCGHCKTEMPILRDLYESEIKSLANIGVFAISTELEYDEWTKFIFENELNKENWVHCIDIYGSNMFRVKYDVTSTPIVIILDKQKKILAKRINVEDIPGLLSYEINKNK
ncbi:MAG: DUF5106 domain-containing protein [Bacteroidetes bacterium]|nr:DUF5106 domain-containing protein [Bacteroidota bacterium]